MDTNTKEKVVKIGLGVGITAGIAANYVMGEVLNATLPGAGTAFKKVVTIVGKEAIKFAVTYSVGAAVNKATVSIIAGVETAEKEVKKQKLEIKKNKIKKEVDERAEKAKEILETVKAV